MSRAMTREEIFQQVLSDRFTGDMTTAELRELCDLAGLFDDDRGIRTAVEKYKDRVILKLARQGGWEDKDGEPLKLYNVVRKSAEGDGKEHRWIDLKQGTFDDLVYLVNDRLHKAEYFRTEARSIYDEGCRRFKRKFQQKFQFD